MPTLATPLRTTVVACILLLGDAVAASWDHDQNVRTAVETFFGIYEKDGISGIAEFVQKCYSDFRVSRESKDLETCVAVDDAALFIDVTFARMFQKKNPTKALSEFQYPYFLPDSHELRTKEGFARLNITGAESDRIRDAIWKTGVFYVQQTLNTRVPQSP